jgi:hypothetical protein
MKLRGRMDFPPPSISWRAQSPRQSLRSPHQQRPPAPWRRRGDVAVSERLSSPSDITVSRGPSARRRKSCAWPLRVLSHARPSCRPNGGRVHKGFCYVIRRAEGAAEKIYFARGTARSKRQSAVESEGGSGSNN